MKDNYLRQAFTSKKSIFGFTFASIAILYLISLTQVSGVIELSLAKIIIEKPLPKSYFLFYFILTILTPYLYKLIFLKTNEKHFLDNYFKFLMSQIIVEIACFLIIGKGFTVLIGLSYSFLRVIQLKKLIYSVNKKDIKTLLIILVVLWSYNVIQILFNRILPLIN